MKPIKVLSLFDGISCGMVALERAGIPVERYVAYEIDDYAIKVSKKNYPLIEQRGDVFEADFTEFQGFDLLIGGSPCTYWSIAKNNRETTPDGAGGQLFMQYVRALKESECRFFLYENNYSIHKNIKDFISTQLGVQPMVINSALVSAQNRRRCYWTNIPGVEQPEDKGIVLQDVLISGAGIHGEKSKCLTASYDGAVLWNSLERSQRTMVAEPVKPVKGATMRGRYLNTNNRSVKQNEETYQAVEVRKDDKSNAITTVTKDCLVVEPADTTKPARLGEFGKGGQAQRIYSVKGKSVTLSANGGGQGTKTGLYKIDLPDGDYVVRKLYPVEAERLQTLPDGYTEGISSNQRYKCIGNGWTVDVIAHILKGLTEVLREDDK